MLNPCHAGHNNHGFTHPITNKRFVRFHPFRLGLNPYHKGVAKIRVRHLGQADETHAKGPGTIRQEAGESIAQGCFAGCADASS